ncbi:MAG: hypothetical protein KAU50_04280 [Candidatus Marinimicrobia bacterium]|nr:hypothetical protein [Candidatus Neomarinimicrobiota bacterium]
MALAVVWPGCSAPQEPDSDLTEQSGDILYAFSFESEEEIDGYITQGMVEFVADAPPDGGSQSISVGGGCIAPHFWLELAPPTENTDMILRCWARNIRLGGGIELTARDTSGHWCSAWVSVEDTNWVYLQSADTLHYQTGQTLALEIMSGGIIGAGAVQVDLLEVVAVP